MIRTSLLVFLLATSSVFAQDWKGMLKQTDRNLRQGNYADARRTSIKLINSMMDNLNHGDRAMYTLALTIAYRAVAEAGLQRYDEADWYWHVARSLYPNFNLEPYGEAGAWLKEHSAEQIETTDAATNGYPTHYAINCAHPTHFDGVLKGEWTSRIGALRANASTSRSTSASS